MGSRADELDALIATITATSPSMRQAAARLSPGPGGQGSFADDRQKVDDWLQAVIDVARIVCEQPHVPGHDVATQLQYLATAVYAATTAPAPPSGQSIALTTTSRYTGCDAAPDPGCHTPG